MYYSTMQNKVYACSEKVLLLINALEVCWGGEVVILVFAEFVHYPLTFASYKLLVSCSENVTSTLKRQAKLINLPAW